MNYKFEHNLLTVETINGLVPTDKIINEPMIFCGSIDFCRENGGELTNKLIDLLENYTQIKNSLDISIDTRSTMTMKGQYPSIPGWHCDFVPRSEKYSQPDLSNISSSVQHYMCILSDCENHTCTEFVIDKPELKIDYQSDIPVWGQVHNQIQNSNYRTRFIKPGEIIQFNQLSIHRASPTKNPGWRFFFRLSTGIKPKNKIRTQVQVYSPIGEGW